MTIGRYRVSVNQADELIMYAEHALITEASIAAMNRPRNPGAMPGSSAHASSP